MPADLAIGIVTLVRRRPFYARLMRRLQPQVDASGGRVCVYALEDSGAEKIGEKRQRLLESVAQQGHAYFCFIDDDDLVSTDYVTSVCEALDTDPDVVGFRHLYYEDGKLAGRSMTSVTCRNWRTEMQKDGTALHYRTPNHLNPVRTEMALDIGYKPMQAGEDADYSDRLYAKYLSRPETKEVFIDKVLYQYFYRTPARRVEGEHLAEPEIPANV
jgi:hypothetical protein